MNKNPCILAPSVMKSLAKKLRTNPHTPDMSTAQSLEDISVLLGCDSWHHAQQLSKCHAPTAQSVFANPQFRQQFYSDLALGFDMHTNSMSFVQNMQTVAALVNDCERELVCAYIVQMLPTKKLSEIVQTLNPNIPLEVLALKSAEQGNQVNMSNALVEAKGFIV